MFNKIFKSSIVQKLLYILLYGKVWLLLMCQSLQTLASLVTFVV